MPFLYDFVVDRLSNGYERRGYNSEYEYVDADATAWGANKAWQLFKDGKTENAFLVGYDDFVLEIRVDWELTIEQKQHICAKANSN